jgi:hypothetical protein
MRSEAQNAARLHMFEVYVLRVSDEIAAVQMHELLRAEADGSQAVNAPLFRVINRYVRNLQPGARRLFLT